MVSAKTNMEIDWQMHREGNIQFTFAYCRLFTVCWINLNSPQWFSYGAQTFTEGQVRQGVYRVRDRDEETVNEGADRQLSLLSQVKQTYPAILTSPHLTTILKKDNESRWGEHRGGRLRGERERHTYSLSFFSSLWWLANTNLETSTRRHWFYTRGCDCDLQCILHKTTKLSRNTADH